MQLPAPTGPHHYWVITDYAAMAPQLQAAGLMSDDDRVKLIGAIAPAQSVPVIRSFFDRHL